VPARGAGSAAKRKHLVDKKLQAVSYKKWEQAIGVVPEYCVFLSELEEVTFIAKRL